MANIVYTYNGKRVSPSSGKVLGREIDPYNPLGLPAYTLRLKFTDGVTPTFSRGTAVQVSSSPNVWDLTYNNASWGALLRTQTDIVEVLGANATGVTAMNNMFRACRRLTAVSLFDTSAVTTMNNMFNLCTALTSAPLFDTSAATDVSSMFYQCTSLTTVPLFNTGNVTNMSNMFYQCEALTTVPLFNTGKVTNMSSMCYGCQALTAVPLFNTGKVTAISSAFQNCYAVQSGALSLYQQASSQAVPPAKTNYTFYNCGSNTTTGAAERAQIPTSWGGTMA